MNSEVITLVAIGLGVPGVIFAIILRLGWNANKRAMRHFDGHL